MCNNYLKSVVLFVLTTALIGTLSCTGEFQPFNELDKLRVLAIKATPPALIPGESAELTALIFEPSKKKVSYQWSWCPLSTAAIGGYECAVDEEQLRMSLDSFLPGSSTMIPAFDMGNDSFAKFEYFMDPALIESLCTTAIADFVPEFTVIPSCKDEFEITIRLEVEAGEESVVAVKKLTLLFTEEARPNSNPVIGNISAFDDEDKENQMEQDVPSIFKERTDYDLKVQIFENSSEEFEQPVTAENPTPSADRENLFMTWFVTGGSTKYQRSTFIYGEIGFDELGSNTWKTPEIDEDNGERATLYLVLQDERGGVEWAVREVNLKDR